MRALQAVLLLLGALAVLTIGVAPSVAATKAPACHDMSAQHGSGSPAAPGDKAVKAMNCCIACVAAPSLRAPERAAPVAPRPAHFLLPGDLPLGEHPAPEPGPPRSRLL